MMRTLFPVLVALYLFGPFAFGAEQGKLPAPARSEAYKTIGDTELKLHVFTPAGWKASDKRPAIVFFFGGGWNGGKASQFFPQCDYLAKRGMVAMSAEYRVKSRDGTTPKECVKDGKSALRWIRKHAARLGVDPKRVAAGGGSAGGHVAAAMGNVDGFEEEGEDLAVSSRPDVLALFNPVFDNSPEGYGHDRVKDYWEAISPMHQIDSKSPPTIVFLGTKDRLIPVATAEAYKGRMEAAGRRCELRLYKDQPHGFFNLDKAGGKYFDKTIRELDDFLVSLGFLEQE